MDRKALDLLWQTQEMVYHHFMAFISCWFHQQEAVTTQPAGLRTDMMAFAISIAWKIIRMRKEGGCFVSVQKKMYSWHKLWCIKPLTVLNILKFSTHFRKDRYNYSGIQKIFFFFYYYSAMSTDCFFLSSRLCCVTGGAQVGLLESIYLGLPTTYRIKNIYGNDATAILPVIHSKC